MAKINSHFPYKNFKTFTIGSILIILVLLVAACGSTTDNSPSNDSGTGSNSNDQSNSAGNTSISIGTHAQGGAYHAVGAGLASVLGTNTSLDVSVKPFQGPLAWMPFLNRGEEVQLGVIPGPEITWALNGTHGFQEENKNLRLLVKGNFVKSIGLTVRADSDVETVSDLKGMRLASDFAGNPSIKAIIDAQLAVNGLTWDDVKGVPVPNVVAGLDALREDRVDATHGTTETAAHALEVDSAIGLRPLNYVDGLSLDDVDNPPQEVMEVIHSYIPNVQLTTTQEGYVKEETMVLGYNIMLVAGASLSDEAAYEIVKTIWEEYEELHGIHPWLTQWNPDIFFDENPAAPYHPGAVKYFEEIGIWTNEMEQIQQELLQSVS